MGKINAKREYRLLTLMFLLLTVLWMYIIYRFSAADAADSGAMSGKLLKKVLALVVPGWDGKTVQEQRLVIGKVHKLFRKCGHFSEYLVLGFFLSVTMALLMPLLPKKMRRLQRHHLLVSVTVPAALAFLYACSDEFHQRFVAGRSGEFRDVMIDFSGACIGILIALPICRYIRRKQDERRRKALEKRRRHRKNHPVPAGSRVREK